MRRTVNTARFRLIGPAREFGVANALFLSMPSQTSPKDADSHIGAPCLQPIDEDLRILRDALSGQDVGRLRPPKESEERIRYRWKIGHHAAFGAWQLLSSQLEAIATAANPQPQTVAEAARLYDVYSVLFLYAGSCSAEQYAKTVRADMIAAHPAFSGKWVRDYEPIPPLMRRIKTTHGSKSWQH